jgi:GNAT superfamily N-acetyltransferase
VITVRPLTTERWDDVEAVFGARGCSVARRCWCMFYRVEASSGIGMLSNAKGNRRALKRLAAGRTPPGLVGYQGRTPVGWISLGPREDYRKLATSRLMKAVDDAKVWSIICFVVPSEFRRQGVASAMLEGAIGYARKRGVKILEAYPVARRGRQADDSMWFGALPMYLKAGFREVARHKPTRAIVRLALE